MAVEVHEDLQSIKEAIDENTEMNLIMLASK